jgi:hypothetical protein
VGKIDPDRNLVIGFRLNPLPMFCEVYFGTARLVCQEIEVV